MEISILFWKDIHVTKITAPEGKWPMACVRVAYITEHDFSRENGSIINNVTSLNFTAMKTRAPVCSTPSQSDRVEC